MPPALRRVQLGLDKRLDFQEYLVYTCPVQSNLWKVDQMKFTKYLLRFSLLIYLMQLIRPSVQTLAVCSDRQGNPGCGACLCHIAANNPWCESSYCGSDCSFNPGLDFQCYT